uniref:Uncharacterized protein n=1 Tax=Amblyomma cajennense TaxID=34607 RepID=A0A023FBK2_AMBCJ
MPYFLFFLRVVVFWIWAPVLRPAVYYFYDFCASVFTCYLLSHEVVSFRFPLLPLTPLLFFFHKSSKSSNANILWRSFEECLVRKEVFFCPFSTHLL